jgi:sugar phosphate isomerase/epimerase
MLGDIASAGCKSIEVFCSPSHFNYAAPQTVRELSSWLTDRGMTLHSLHSPTERESVGGRESGSPVSLCDTERVRRLDAVDQVKRALDVAEDISFKYFVQHLAQARQSVDPRRIDAAFNSLEHLVIFAKQRGVTIALENTVGEFGAPSSLHNFVVETHLKDLRFCFDIGHAHIESGVAAGFEAMRDRVVTTHIHDNHGEKDEHLLPGDGTIDWEEAYEALAAAPFDLPIVLELKEQTGAMPGVEQVEAAFSKIERGLDAKRVKAPQS